MATINNFARKQATSVIGELTLNPYRGYRLHHDGFLINGTTADATPIQFGTTAGMTFSLAAADGVFFLYPGDPKDVPAGITTLYYITASTSPMFTVMATTRDFSPGAYTAPMT